MAKKNQLVPFDGTLPAVQDEKALEDGIGSGDYTPYIMLHADNGKYRPDIKGGLFILVRDQKPEVLGASIDVFLLEYRMLSMKYGDWGQDREYDTETEKWELFKKKANSKIQETDGSRYYWGVEYLMYLPASKEIVTFYCNNPTQRRAAKEQLKTKMRVQLTFTADWIEGPQFQWWGFKVTPCDVQYEQGDLTKVTKCIEEFKNPKLSEMPEGTEEAPAENQSR